MTHDHKNNKKLMGKLAYKVLVVCCYCPGLLTAAEGFLLCNYSPALASLPVWTVLLCGVCAYCFYERDSRR